MKKINETGKLRQKREKQSGRVEGDVCYWACLEKF